MNIHKHKSQPYNNTNNNQLTPELNHHLISSRRSGPLGLVLPTKNKRWNSSSQNPAFTIIEVVLVLAIAGLIFLMVFIALPTLQRNQRDTQRKNDLSRLKTALDSYKSNSKGQIPTQAGFNSFIDSYIKINGEPFTDPSGTDYIFGLNYDTSSNVGWKPTDTNYHSMHFGAGMKCDGEAKVVANGMNNYSLQMKLESGGVYCIDG